jgi:hypothetical protein
MNVVTSQSFVKPYYTLEPMGECDGVSGWTRVLRHTEVIQYATSESAARAWIAERARSCHFAAGSEARIEGRPRELPTYFTDRKGKNAKAWLHGYDGTKPTLTEQDQSDVKSASMP